MDLRQLLVPEMAFCAAKNRTDQHLNELAALLSESDNKSMAEKDIQLHHIIARASGNVLYVLLLNAFTTQMNDYYAMYFRNPENIDETRMFHKEIYTAIEDRKPEKAKQIMRRVLKSAAKKSMRMLAG